MHCHRNYTVTVISLETSAGWAGPAQESEPVIPFNPAETYHTVVTHGNQNDEYDIPITKKGADSTFDFMLKLQYYFQNTPKTLTTFKERVIKLAVERRDDHLYRNALYFDPQDPRFSNGAIFEVTFQRRYDIVVVAHPRTHREPSPRSTVAYVSRSKPIAKPLSQPTRMGTAPAPRPSSPPNHPAQPNPPMPQNGAENAGTVEANAPPPRPNAAPDGVDGGAGIAKQSASLIVDTLPVAGTFKSLFQLAAGYDPITGETIDRRMELAGLALSVIPGGKLLTKGKKLANLGEELLEHVDDINRVAKAAERGVAGGTFDLGVSGSQYTLRAPTIAGFEGASGTVSTRAFAVHGNSALSPRPATLYELYLKDGTFLKYGISQNPAKRYSNTFMADKDIFRVATGTRADMLALERQMVTQNPGPLNFEPWAVKARGGN